jgi:hypothetical protein
LLLSIKEEILESTLKIISVGNVYKTHTVSTRRDPWTYTKDVMKCQIHVEKIYKAIMGDNLLSYKDLRLALLFFDKTVGKFDDV